MKHTRRATLFLASPSDVSDERQAVREIVAELNRTVGRQKGVNIEVIGWETDTSPDFGTDGQAVINGQIADMSEHDLFVGILWNRFGTPTARAESGTHEEFLLAEKSFRERGTPKIMLYFSTKPATLDMAGMQQRMKVLEFRNSVKSEGLIWDYDGPEAFAGEFRRHLTSWLLSIQSAETPSVAAPNGEESGARTSVPKASAVPTEARTSASSGDWILLGERFFRTRKVIESAGRMELSVSPGDDADDEALRQLSSRRGDVGFAHQNQAGVAQVQGAERSSGPEGDVWTVVLRPQKSEGTMQDMSYNGVTSAQIAEMRARLILLDEPVPNKGDTFLDAFVQGHVGGSAVVGRGLLPDLWKRVGADPERFLPLARLLAVYHLKTTGTIEQVKRLVVGPIDGAGVKISFEGLRPKAYSNHDPETIVVDGKCLFSPEKDANS